ncbi:hypothetical protein [Litchfieldia alkalitelluris]|uniref:hypothetical protein n=1 Tax=Litchfieldia alkalitelluris TaxID=304268 RepID=UPI0014757B5B|nr:hypothetical protein [Litchfieldia alkalitelluris]
MTQIIVNTEDVEGTVENNAIVYYNGEPFKVVDANYRDEKGEGVLLEVIMLEPSSDYIH